MIDTTRIKEAHDLKDVVCQALGQPEDTRGQWVFWSCPFHTETTPSFGVKDDRYKCFGCGMTGDVIEFIKEIDKLDFIGACKQLGGVLHLGDDEAVRARVTAIRQERERQEAEKQADALGRIAGMIHKVQWYHSQLDRDGARDYWLQQGLTNETVAKFQLGYTPECPVDRRTPSYTIPYFESGVLTNIRHRLKFPNGKGKYRPEFAGLGNRLFNADSLKTRDEFGFEENTGLLVEGEIKAMVLWQQLGFKTVGIAGQNGWKPEWVSHFSEVERVYVALDPDAAEAAYKIGYDLVNAGLRVRVAMLPAKPDDMFVRYGCTPDGFMSYLRLGRRL